MPKSIEDIITSYGRLMEKSNAPELHDRALVLCNSYGNIITCWVLIKKDDYDGAMPDMLDILKMIVLNVVNTIERS